jgi:hypothetical protein
MSFFKFLPTCVLSILFLYCFLVASLTVHDLIHFLGNLDWWKDEITPITEEVDLSKVPETYQNKILVEMDLRKRRGCDVIG